VFIRHTAACLLTDSLLPDVVGSTRNGGAAVLRTTRKTSPESLPGRLSPLLRIRSWSRAGPPLAFEFFPELEWLVCPKQPVPVSVEDYGCTCDWSSCLMEWGGRNAASLPIWRLISNPCLLQKQHGVVPIQQIRSRTKGRDDIGIEGPGAPPFKSVRYDDDGAAGISNPVAEGEQIRIRLFCDCWKARPEGSRTEPRGR